MVNGEVSKPSWQGHLDTVPSTGQQLLQYDIKPEGPPTPRTLHTLAPDDAFVALARPARAPAGAGSPGVAHLVAASTLKEVLLMDLRRPGQALLRWHHGAHSLLLGQWWLSCALCGQT